MRVRGNHDAGLACAERRTDEFADCLQQELVRLVELDEVLGPHHQRRIGLRILIGVRLMHNPRPVAGGPNMNRQPLEILTLDPRGAVTQAYDRQVSSPNPAPDTDPAYAEKLGRLGNAEV